MLGSYVVQGYFEVENLNKSGFITIRRVANIKELPFLSLIMSKLIILEPPTPQGLLTNQRGVRMRLKSSFRKEHQHGIIKSLKRERLIIHYKLSNPAHLLYVIVDPYLKKCNSRLETSKSFFFFGGWVG